MERRGPWDLLFGTPRNLASGKKKVRRTSCTLKERGLGGNGNSNREGKSAEKRGRRRLDKLFKVESAEEAWATELNRTTRSRHSTKEGGIKREEVVQKAKTNLNGNRSVAKAKGSTREGR